MAKEYVDETGLDKYDQLIKNKLADDIGRTEGKITPHINSRVTDSPEGIHGLYIGDSDRIKIDPDGDGSYVNLVLPPDCGGTGCTSEQETRNSLGLGDTLGPLPIECGGTGSNSLNSIFSDLVKINEQTKYTFVHEIGNKTNVTGHQYPTKKSGPDSLPSGYYRPISFKIETTNLVSDNSYPHLRAYNTDTDLNALIPSPFNNNGDNATTFPVTWSPSEPSSNQLKNLVGKNYTATMGNKSVPMFSFPGCAVGSALSMLTSSTGKPYDINCGSYKASWDKITITLTIALVAPYCTI